MFKNKDGWYVNLYEVESVGEDSIHMKDSLSLFVDYTDKPPISPGDIAVVYSTSNGWGGRVMGLFVDGVEYISYKTKEQADADRQEWLDDLQAKRQADYNAHIDEWIETKLSLRQPFQDRLNRFEEESGFENFWLDSGSYELFCLEQANALLNYAESKVTYYVSDFIDSWKSLPYAEQTKMPGFKDEHSGWTFEVMVGMAKAVAEGKEI